MFTEILSLVGPPVCILLALAALFYVSIEPFDDLRTQTSTDNTDLLNKSRADVHMSRHGSIKVRQTPSVGSRNLFCNRLFKMLNTTWKVIDFAG
jgi:hypothetical protein